MANANSAQSLYNVPAQTISTTTETALLVPAATLYSGYPSPILAAGAGFPIIIDPTAQTNNPTATTPTYTNANYDGHPIGLRASLLITFAAAATCIVKLYQVPSTIIVAGTQSTLSNDHLIATGATLTAGAAGTFNYLLDVPNLLWDSTSKHLNGSFSTLADGTLTGAVATTQQTGVAFNDLNFLLSFTFSVAGVNTVAVKEFTLSQN
jgi:hypothetical protein